MQLATRFIVDAALRAKLTIELENLASVFSSGVAVRLHSLGDFADLPYAKFWLSAVQAIRPLHVFGFTAHTRQSEIGAAIEEASLRWDRFRIRFSGGEGERSAVVLEKAPWGRHAAGVTCPADPAHPEISCGSCGLCVTSRARIAFGLH